MTKQFILALLGYCVLLSSLIAQNPDCPPTIFVDLPKMKVLYVGIDNPIKVSHEGLSSSDFQVKVDKGTLTSTGTGLYNLTVSSPGEVVLTVSTYKGSNNFNFRAKRIPDPVPVLGAKFSRSDTIGLGVFKAQAGITLLLENFDFDAKCDMVDYKITHIGVDYVEGKMFTKSVRNKGSRFGDEAKKLISEAAPDDIFIFSEIKGRCPGDLKPRELNALVFFMESIGHD